MQNVKSEYEQEEFKALKGGQLIGSVNKSVQKIHMLFKKNSPEGKPGTSWDVCALRIL